MHERIKRLLEYLRYTANNEEPNKAVLHLDSGPAYGRFRCHACHNSVAVYGGDILELLRYIDNLERGANALWEMTPEEFERNKLLCRGIGVMSPSAHPLVPMPFIDSSIDPNFDREGNPQIPKA